MFLHLLSVLMMLRGLTPLVFLVKWVCFLGSLHWPVHGLDLGVGGISYVELLILYELWAGERLVLEKAHPRYLRRGRPFSVSAVPFGPGIDIWRSCRFLGSIMRSLCLLPGGLGRFVPCSIVANHYRRRRIGWDSCGHGLTSRPRESASVPFLNELLKLFGYPSAGVVIGGVMSIVFILRGRCILAEVFALFLGLCSLFSMLKFGVSF